MLKIFKITALFITILSTISMSAQEASLKIGDQAPPLKYSKWIKGKPVESLTGNQLYVLEFWATWCGPCRMAMPGLTKLAKEYQGKAEFIGAGVWEKVKPGLPYESSLSMVTKFVKGNTANMEYHVIADNNEQYLGNNWLKAAGINGIPATFVVKNNQIIWIGHPMLLDSMMPLFLNGKYDMKQYSASYYKQEENSAGAQIGRVVTPINDLLTKGDFKAALELTNRSIMINDATKRLLNKVKFYSLLRIDEAEAVKHAEKVMKDDPNAAGPYAMDIDGNDSLSSTTYLYGVKLVEDAIPTMKGAINPMVYDVLASLYAKAGDMEKAISNQEKAINLLKDTPDDKVNVGMAKADKLVELQETLSRYRKMSGKN